MRWIREHILFSTIFIIVVLLVLMVVFSFFSGGGGNVVSKSTQSIVTTIEKPFVSISSGVRNTFKGVFNYRKVVSENDELKDQVAELENQNIELKMKQDELDELGDLSKAFNFEPFKGQSEAVAGNIIALDNSNIYDIFTIDVGADKGIEKEDIVVDGNGIIGKIDSVNKNTSKVISIIDSSNKISFRVKRKNSILGVLHGDGKGKLTGYLLNNKASVVKDDVLITSGIGLYPKGIKIGKISKIEFDSDTDLKIIEVKPTVDFTALQKVAVYK